MTNPQAGTNLRQLDSIHNYGLRLALGAFCTSPVSILYTETNEAPLEKRRLKLSMHYYLKTRACINNPARYALPEFDQTTRDLYVPRPNGRGGMKRPSTHPIGLKVEAAMASAEIDAKLVRPLRIPAFPPGTHNYNPKRHNLIEGVNKCMISRPEAQAKFRVYQETLGSHDEVFTDGSKMNERVGAAAVINHHLFPEWWDNLPLLDQKIARQQYHLCCWGYSHHSGTELLPTHGPNPPRCNSLLWLNVLLAGDWGWRHWEPFYLPYHEPPLVVEWQRHTYSFLLDTKPLWHRRKWKSWPAGEGDPWPWHRSSGGCPLCRFETTGQLLHPAVGSNQVGCGCTWQRSLFRKTNTGATVKPTLGPPKKFQHLTRAEEVVITDFESAIQRPPSPISCPDDHRLLVTIAVKHWPLTICSWSVQCYMNAVMNTTQPTHWIPSSRQFPRLALWNSCEKWDSSIWYDAINFNEPPDLDNIIELE